MGFFSYLHIGSVVISYLSAFLIFSQRVGGTRHRTLGISYAVAMLTAALSGFGIYTSGSFSVFHIFSVVTIVTISRGWWAIRRFLTGGDRSYLAHHYFNMAYSFMGLNLAALAQGLRIFHFDSGMAYLTAVGLVYLVAVTIANRLIQKVYYRRFSPWFGPGAARAA